MDGAVILMEGARAKICGLCDLGGEVGFADPGALLMREDDGDGVARFLEGVDEGVDVGGGLCVGLDILNPWWGKERLCRLKLESEGGLVFWNGGFTWLLGGPSSLTTRMCMILCCTERELHGGEIRYVCVRVEYA